VTRREKHMTALDLAGDFLEARRPLEIAGVELGADEILAAIRWVRGHDGAKGAPDAAPPWWAQVVYELREQRREDREEAYADAG
jgi:hypothetical protein